IRIPTTVLSQNDSGVGVKNGINYFGKKNFIGTFAPPFAVINDFNFLKTLSDRDFRCGIAEAVKVGLVKDASFFNYIEKNADALNQREHDVSKQLIYRCAEIHLKHISGGDPFEKGNSRPLDYGHWSAHKIEQLSKYQIRHGEAVIMGMCLDAVYANLSGLLSKEELSRLIQLSKKTGFQIFCPEMELKDSNGNILINGLQEFREHLGGELTIMLLEKIGKGIEVHEVDNAMMLKAISVLKELN
ncbi:MAG TPA: 3-dehydroquinate synthase, partial [Bacteroidia bacterium]|nr:3-dehydroquinate synthase [Bacteroidia bacterium]